MRDTKYTAAPGVRVLETQDGCLLLDLETNAYYSLNRTGVTAWEGITQGHTEETLARRFEEHYGVPRSGARKIVEGFVRELAGESLLVKVNLGEEAS